MENRYNPNIRGFHNIKKHVFSRKQKWHTFLYLLSWNICLLLLDSSQGLPHHIPFYDLFGTGNFFTSPTETTSLIKMYGDC